MAGLESITSPKLKCKPKRGPENYCRLQGSVHCFLHIPFLRKNPGFVVGLAVLDCQNYGPFLGPYHNTGPNTGPNLGDPKRDHNFDNPPYTM